MQVHQRKSIAGGKKKDKKIATIYNNSDKHQNKTNNNYENKKLKK